MYLDGEDVKVREDDGKREEPRIKRPKTIYGGNHTGSIRNCWTVIGFLPSITVYSHDVSDT